MFEGCRYSGRYQAKRVPKCNCGVCWAKYGVTQRIKRITLELKDAKMERKVLFSKKPPRPPQRVYKNGVLLPAVPNLSGKRGMSPGKAVKPKQRIQHWN